jgi:hypothetical protein
MLQHVQHGYTVNLDIHGNESDAYFFQNPTYTSRLTTPLGFDYDSRISGSIAVMLEACNLVNIHTLQHSEAPETNKQGSHQIYFMFISRSLVRHVKGCGILPFESMFPIDHTPLYVDFDVATLFGHPSIGTEKAAKRDLRDLQIDNTHLIDAYESALCKQLKNHNVEIRVSKRFMTHTEEWNNNNQFKFNQVDRDTTRAMQCAVTKC